MKLKHFFKALAVLVVLAITGCKNGRQNLLVGKWKVINATGPMITPEVKAQYVGEANTIEFMKDGSYIAQSKGKEEDHGSYILSKNGQTLVTKAASGQSDTIFMKELTTDKMITTIGTLEITFEPSK